MSSAPRSRADAARLLREVLLDPAEAAGLDVHGRIDAAVLVPLYVQDGELHVVFTRRRADLRRHAGEISFPGGRQDDDETDLRLTALREAEEEIGLPADAVELVLRLPPDASEEKVEKLRVIAAKCPVHRTLDGEVMFNERVERLELSAS